MPSESVDRAAQLRSRRLEKAKQRLPDRLRELAEVGGMTPQPDPSRRPPILGEHPVAGIYASPYDAARLTYGDKTDSILASRKRNLERLASQIPSNVGEYMPSYDSAKLNVKIPVYQLPPSLRIAGSAGITHPDPLSVVIGPGEPQDTVDHEMTHAAGILHIAHPSSPFGAEQYSPDFVPDDPTPANLEYARGVHSLVNSEEPPAYATAVARHFYRTTGRTIDDDKTAQEALDLYDKRAAGTPVNRGIMDAIEKLPYIKSLLQTLALSDRWGTDKV